MKNEDIKAVLKETFQTKIPDITSRINLSQIAIEPKKTSGFHFGIANSWRLATVLVLALLITFGLLATNKNLSPITPITLSAETTSSFTAVSSSVLLNAKKAQATISSGQMILSANLNYNNNHNNKNTVMTNKVSFLNPYFNMIELFLVEDELSFSTPVASNLAGYELMMSYQMVDLTGASQTYTYYFTETIDEGKVLIEGLIKISDATYYLEGIKETSDDETKIMVKTYSSPTEKNDNYVETESIKKQDQQTFIYSVFVDGEEKEVSELKLEHKGKNTKIKLKYENNLSDEEIQIEAIRVIELGKSVLKVKYDIENSLIDESGEMTVYVKYDESSKKNQYVYEIKNNKGYKNEYFGSRKNVDDDEDSDKED